MSCGEPITKVYLFNPVDFPAVESLEEADSGTESNEDGDSWRDNKTLIISEN